MPAHLEAIVEEGDAGTVIHNVVQRQGADLVMLSTRGLCGDFSSDQ